MQPGSHSPARERGHFSLRGDSGSICACQHTRDNRHRCRCCRRRSSPPTARLFRRSQSEPWAWSGCPAPRGVLRCAGLVRIGRLPGAATGHWRDEETVTQHLSSLLGQWQRQPLLFVPSCRRVGEARFSRLLLRALECCSSQEFELLPTLKSAHVRMAPLRFPDIQTDPAGTRPKQKPFKQSPPPTPYSWAVKDGRDRNPAVTAGCQRRMLALPSGNTGQKGVGCQSNIVTL